ncbi:MAG: ABC transporter permease [Anaerolineales bacterium]
MQSIKASLRDLLRYPSAVMGSLVLLGVIALAIYAVVTIPYNEALRLWRGGPDVWYMNPRNALPKWVNLFRSEQLPESIAILNTDESVDLETKETTAGFSDLTYTFHFDYPYDEFPQEMAFFFTSEFVENEPFVSVYWTTPDGREFRIVDMGVSRQETYRFSQDERLTRRLGNNAARIALFQDPDSDPEDPIPLKGEYQVELKVLTFEENSTIEAEFVLHGEVYGLAGTDHRRRDLMVSLLWGAPIALAFGLVGAVGSSVTTIILAAIGVWYGGVVDGIIQRITEVNLTLPFLSILIMVGTFYSKSLWVILGVTIVLIIFGAAIKTYRAMFLQVKESPYIEAALAYGATDVRIVMLYLLPRLVPVLIPALILSVPTFVFLEATLAVLGLGDPVLPTWGKIIYDAWGNAAVYNGYYYWMLEPAVLLTLTGIGFSLVGFSLDRIFNPRLRGL